jgi:hypothetical protein
MRNDYSTHPKTTVMLHRFVMSVTDPTIEVDHEDHNGLNCQRYNLRLCTHTQNQGNRRKQTSSSQFKGVYWNKAKKKWQAGIQINGKSKHLGYFAVEQDAGLAYANAAKKVFGAFANT